MLYKLCSNSFLPRCHIPRIDLIGPDKIATKITRFTNITLIVFII